MLSVCSKTWMTAVATTSIAGFRILMHSELPKFNSYDNPLILIKDQYPKILSIINVMIMHVKMLIFPNILSFDWSKSSNIIIGSIFDHQFRVTLIIMSMNFLLFTFYIRNYLINLIMNEYCNIQNGKCKTYLTMSDCKDNRSRRFIKNQESNKKRRRKTNMKADAKNYCRDDNLLSVSIYKYMIIPMLGSLS